MLSSIDAQIAYLVQYDPLYEWRGSNAVLVESRDREIVLSGPSETGKTMAACYKSHQACRAYAGAQGALVRKIAVAIPGTVLQTMKRVIGSFPVEYYGGDKTPERIIYPNGSVIWIGGMDNPTRVLSGERDFIQVCQTEELSLDDWEIMTTRTTGRGAVMPYTQVYGDCNPSRAKHWIRERAALGHLRFLETYHRDNPSLYDTNGELTEQGKNTMERLRALTGIRRKRLLEGQWVTAEGVVFDNIRTREITDEEIYGADDGYGNRSGGFDNVLHGLDFGYYPHPAHYIQCAYNGNHKTLYIFGEVRKWKTSNSDMYQALLDYGYNCNDLLIADSAEPKSVDDFRAYGSNCRGAEKGPSSLSYSMKWLQSRTEIVIDPKRCPYAADEFLNYVYETTRTGETIDAFQDENDHAIAATRYATNLIWRRRGE